MLCSHNFIFLKSIVALFRWVIKDSLSVCLQWSQVKGANIFLEIGVQKYLSNIFVPLPPHLMIKNFMNI